MSHHALGECLAVQEHPEQHLHDKRWKYGHIIGNMQASKGYREHKYTKGFCPSSLDAPGNDLS